MWYRKGKHCRNRATAMKMAILLNHVLSEEQKQQAKTTLGVSEFISLPPELKGLWSDADPCASVGQLGVQEIICWLSDATSCGDYVLVQGDYALTFAVVDWCLSHKRVAVHATTKRCASETLEDGVTVVKREFRHVKFREYERYNGKEW
ncbi:CRISPR-associated protein Csx20 [Chitinispirillales bacterium ANBcel5]|uniref:CRISPR-associated protein Csx20 n=1 Tax=Cellulosispirillum alkaliphilum TaxID=3039283 RepID=UPI002A51D325|nr:CRISPR-associated protein Csx20 [Chitinispirillales bacterium ANBcel5]